MPFTFAHPAAVLPLRHMRLMRTVPLIIGAMTPDVPYFLPWRITKHLPETTHTVLGSFTLDLPIGAALLLFLWLLRVPLAAPLGPATRAKCLGAVERFGSEPLSWALAPLSLLIGAWTHLLWDSFTHPDGWMVLRISALSAPVTVFSYTGQLCHVLQYASSVFGLVVMAIWFALLPAPAQRPNGERGGGGPLLLAAVFAAAVVAGGFEVVLSFLPHIPATYRLIYLLLTRTAAWFALLYTVTGIIIVRWWRRTPTASVTQM